MAAEEKWSETEEGFDSLQEEIENIETQTRQIGEDKEKTVRELEDRSEERRVGKECL